MENELRGAKERRGGRRRSEGESTQESRRRGERHADVEHAGRVEEEALRGAVARGERRGVSVKNYRVMLLFLY